ncbi:MAG TPA: ATP-dependent RecD-like DNA helicase [Lachnospiraceae bacterium]|nr:ATP-dependent RecD-like DNA helicase [Lachnospiraceae bacterium]
MEEIRGYVDHIIFRNQENGYTVLNLISDGEEQTCVGTFPSVDEGMSMVARGEYTTHPSYGQQFRIREYEETMLQDAVSAERYLSSGAIRGIGAALAARIVKRFGEDTFRIIEEEPERLAEIKGISERKAREIAEQVSRKREMRSAMMYLQKYGIAMNLAVKIYQTYGAELYDMIRTNPYKLADDMTGVGFRTADEIARRAGIHRDSDFRIRSGILYMLQQAALQGNTCLPARMLTEQTAQMLEVDEEAVRRHYMDLAIDRKVVLKETEKDLWVYATAYYYMEENTAYMLGQLNAEYDVPEREIEEQVRKIEKESGLEPEERQMEAVKAAIRNGLLVITGGPGTGKTTIINMILRYFDQEGCDILLAAPTGRAAKRMSEATGYEAKTIHRMLELSGGIEGNAGFERNAENPLEADVIIIDEMSMVDISLMYALLKAVLPGTRLILVGDINQLPSVGPGTVLKDIIDSGICHTVRLNRIFRQASSSDIIVNAHRINAGEAITVNNKSRDFFFLKRYDANEIIGLCIKLIRDSLPKYIQADSREIQLLTPMRKGMLGVERLNKIMQQYLNPPDPSRAERQQGSDLFREGDKVMQIRNNYQLEWTVSSKYGIPIDRGVGVFNGDTGVIRCIDEFSQTVTVEYEDRRKVDYEFGQLDELELAYAVTIHKSQGSEYPAVVIPLLSGPRMLMNRNLLYTAVTRAKNCVVLVGDEQVFQGMIANASEQKRYSGLLSRLKEEMHEGENPMEKWSSCPDGAEKADWPERADS